MFFPLIRAYMVPRPTPTQFLAVQLCEQNVPVVLLLWAAHHLELSHHTLP